MFHGNTSLSELPGKPSASARHFNQTADIHSISGKITNYDLGALIQSQGDTDKEIGVQSLLPGDLFTSSQMGFRQPFPYLFLKARFFL